MGHYKLILVMLSLVAFLACRSNLNVLLKALFMGNCLTYSYNMSYTFKVMAISIEKKRLGKIQTKRGSARSHHVNTHKVYNLERNAKWYIVVLQPGTGESGIILYRGPDTDHAGAIR